MGELRHSTSVATLAAAMPRERAIAFPVDPATGVVSLPTGLPPGTSSYSAPPLRARGRKRMEPDLEALREHRTAEWRAAQHLRLTPAQDALIREWSAAAVGLRAPSPDFVERWGHAFCDEVVTAQREAALSKEPA